MFKREVRCDVSEVKMTKTKEGYLRGQAVVSRTGVLRYVNKDGTERLELRLPEEVFEEESLNSLKQIPVTFDHPKEFVNSQNSKKYSIGMTGETVSRDGDNLICSFTITDSAAVEKIENRGHNQLSLGYELEVEPFEGEYNGQRHTHVQRKIVYNHLAVVSRARAGVVASMNLDGYNIFMNDDESEVPSVSDKNTDKVTLAGGIVYDVPPEVRHHIDEAAKNIDSADKEMDAMNKRYNELKAKYDELEAQNKKLKEKNTDAEVAEAVKSRLALVARATDVADIESPETMSDRDIMVTAIKARHDSFDDTDKDDAYIAARFDAVCEMPAPAKEVADNISKQRSDAQETEIKAEANFDSWAQKAREGLGG